MLVRSLQSPTKCNKKIISDLKIPAYLYFSLAVLWLYSGIVPVLFAQAESLNMLARLGINATLQMPIFLMSSLLDIAFGLIILSRYRMCSWVWLAQLVVVLGYSIIVAIGLPENWTHPFAPLIKNIPIVALLLFLYQYHLKRQ